MDEQNIQETQETPEVSTEEVYETPTDVEIDTQLEEPEVSEEDIKKTRDYSEEFTDEELNEKDEKGVPLRNRLAEARRKQAKAEREAEQLRQQQVQEAQPEYTLDQLSAFYEYTDDPQSKAWAAAEYKKLEDNDLTQKIRNEWQNLEAQKQYNQAREQAVYEVKNLYPEMFDPKGGWNEKSQLFQRTKQYFFSDPNITNHPSGLSAAARLAAADLSRGTLEHRAKETQALRNKVAKLQRQTVVEGAGSPSAYSQPSADFASAIQKLRSGGGTVKAGSEAMGHILRKSGFLE
ncbi:MAG: hypothetical protein PHY73_02025 [Candidatus Omnitrophica bacterium]|nr:hypothetical protein [Candidatus Omnitrophota bacterium]